MVVPFHYRKRNPMKRQLLAAPLALAAAMTLFAGPSATAATSAPAKAQGCSGVRVWTITEGHGEIQWCDRHVWGWIRDDRADGRCPFFKVYTSDNRYEESVRVGPATTTKGFDWIAANEPQDAFLKWASC